MPPISAQKASDLDPAPFSRHADAKSEPTISTPTYNDALENLLEFLIAFYCVYALYCFMHTILLLAAYMAKKTTAALNSAFAGPMTFELRHMRKHERGRTVDSCTDEEEDKRKEWEIWNESTELWADLSSTGKTVVKKKKRKKGVNYCPLRQRSNTV